MLRVGERMGGNIRYSGFAMRKILRTRAHSEFGVRNPFFGIRSSESILSDPLMHSSMVCVGPRPRSRPEGAPTMSKATPPMIPEAAAPLEIPGSVARVPSLDGLHRPTAIPERRVVFRG